MERKSKDQLVRSKVMTVSKIENQNGFSINLDGRGMEEVNVYR